MTEFVVFISSSMEELRNEREAVKRAFSRLKRQRLNIRTYMFETDAGADPNPIPDVWRAALQESNIYVGLFYKKYGKYTIEEFELAQSRALPCFIYVCDYHVSTTGVVQREPALQTFLDKLKSYSNLTVSCFKNAYDLEKKVARDFIRWVFGEGRLAERRLAIVRSELRDAHRQLGAQAAEILQLEERLSRVSSVKTSQALENQIHELREREQRLKQQVSKWQQTARQLKQRVAELEKHLEQAQSATTSGVPSLQASASKEEIAENIKRLLEAQMRAHVTLTTFAQHIDLETRMELDGISSYSLLLRIVDAPVTFDAVQLLENKIAANVASGGLLLGVQPHLQESLLELYHGEHVHVFLMDSSASWENQIRFGFELFEAYTFIRLGDERYVLGDFRGAIQWYQSAAKIASSHAYHDPALAAWIRVSEASHAIPDIKQAIESATSALVLARKVQSVRYELKAILCLVEALGLIDLRNRWHEVQPLLIAGIEQSRMLDDSMLQVDYLMRLGEISIRLYEAEEAYTCLQDALNALNFHTNGARKSHHCRLYLAFSEWHRKHGSLNEALRYVEMAIGVARESKSPYLLALSQLGMAHVGLLGDEYRKALGFAEEALLQARKMGWKNVEQQGEGLQCKLAYKLGLLDEAETAARKALDLAREIQTREAEVESLLNWGEVLLARQHYTDAHDKLNQARRLSQERDYADHFAQAEKLLQSLTAQGAVQ